MAIERYGRKLGVRGVCGMHMSDFDLEHVKVILESSGTLSSKLSCNSKMAGHRGKWTKLEGIWNTFNLEHVKVI